MGNGQPEVVEELTRRGYADVTLVGRGGHAVVYRAEQTAFGRTVAIKVLTDSDLDPVAFERFERERKALGSMSNHPNILTVYEGGVTRTGQAFLVTEYAPRGTLGERVARRGPVPWPEAVATGIKLAGALETAHRRGVVHRDVKPENVLLSDYGEPLLGDFGIARITGGFVTSTTIIRASVAHVPPEVLAGDRPRPSTDVYSLASTLLTAMWGRPPFFHEDEAVPPLYERIACEAPPDLRTRGVPGALCRVLERGLAKRASDRPPSALAFGEELQAAQRAMGQAVTALPLVTTDGDAEDLGPPIAPEGPPPRWGMSGPQPGPASRLGRRRSRRRSHVVRIGALAAALAVFAAVAVAALTLRGGDEEAVVVPADGLALGPDRLWAVDRRADGSDLAAFGLTDGRPVDEAPEAPPGVVAVDADERSIWVLDDEGAHRLADAGGGLLQPLDGRPVAIEVDGDRVWVLDVVGDDLVVGSFDVDGGPEVLQERAGPARAGRRGALAVEGGEAWITNGGGTLARYVPDGSGLERVDAGVDVLDVALQGPWAWAATADGRLLRFDRTSDSLAVTEVDVSTEAIVEVVAVDGNIWTVDQEGKVRRVLEDETEARAALRLDEGRKVLGAAADGSAVYVANAETGMVDRLDPVSGEADPDQRIDLTAGF